MLEEVLGPGDGARGTEKRQVDTQRVTISGFSAPPNPGCYSFEMGKGPLVAAFSLSLLATLVTVDAQVGSRRLTIDDIYTPSRRINFSGTPETNISWLDSRTYLTRRRATGGTQWLKVDAQSGRTSPLFDASSMEAALASLPGVTRDEAAQIAHSDDLILNPGRTGALLTIADDLYFYDVRVREGRSAHCRDG